MANTSTKWDIFMVSLVAMLAKGLSTWVQIQLRPHLKGVSFLMVPHYLWHGGHSAHLASSAYKTITFICLKPTHNCTVIRHQTQKGWLQCSDGFCILTRMTALSRPISTLEILDFNFNIISRIYYHLCWLLIAHGIQCISLYSNASSTCIKCQLGRYFSYTKRNQ